LRREVTPQNKENARDLRRRRTKPETLLRKALSNSRKLGVPLRFQHCIGPYIVDFACIRAKIVVEIDGWSHIDRETPDARRQKWLESQGWTVLRYTNDAVLADPSAVAEDILRQALAAIPGSSPKPGGG
jgi:very-short-patch-repair endonuclease